MRLRHGSKPDCISIARLSPESLALLSSSAFAFSWFGLRWHKTQYMQAECDECHHVFCAKCGAGPTPTRPVRPWATRQPRHSRRKPKKQ